MTNHENLDSESGPAFDTEQIRVPVSPPAALGLGLCDINKIMTPEQIAELDKDLSDIAHARTTLPEGWNTDMIAG